jgi:hypothetical protein
MPLPPAFPGGKRFAFTIVDDTDVATVANVKPFYDLLHQLGMRTTKTVWPVACPEGSRNYHTSQTLEDEEYRLFVLDLQRKGFEITWHGPTMESSRRERTLAALERFRETLGTYPRIHINHSYNRENLYWGAARLDETVLRALIARVAGGPSAGYVGDVPGSPYYWGDMCVHFTYARNLTCNDINTAGFNPSMPYRDERRSLIPWWFSATDAEGVYEFNELLAPANQARLEEDGGVCILATHLGKGYVRDGMVHPLARERLEALSRRPGWFPPVGELLDWLRLQGAGDVLPREEWRRMQWRWVRDLAVRRLTGRTVHRRRVNGEIQ